ncbi:common plant regulatory factor 1 [Morus notabilis]|uniref:common plant regulatory factor 1 n=1 Tax=Morus notabilis TaxID=981085 RepID=UPI000CECEF2E|nr:common plant regulatory factor 1 [Morus notabilis]XP_024019008.1 common plant regulatory factor 1 [Morus notabilis]XP_024019009.1 common plant regulatory factor 1 [Morus notabilis]
MGNDEEGKSAKSEKSSAPSTPDQTNHTNQTNVHVYPDWAAMQAYYGPRVTLPPYYNSAVASGHAPHPYMWGPPQAMMPPYGAPYAAIYSHGSVYAHPAVPVAAHGQGIPSSPAAAPPLSVETPTKSSGTTEKELVKKLKGFDGLAMSIGNGNAEAVAEQRASQSTETDGSSDGSDGNSIGANQSRRKRSREGTPTTVGDEKTEKQAKRVSTSEINAVSDKTLGATVPPSGIPGKLVGSVVSPGMTTALELRNSNLSTKTSPTATLNNTCAVLPADSWLHNERELKRERRKQSNRESARRSRLRKQAETEELGHKVESLTAENVALQSELNRLTENSKKLRLENAKLEDKLKNVQLGHTEKILLNDVDKPISTENLLSRVNNSGSIDRTAEEENDMYEKNSNSGAKLHQLLDTSPRADAVAAG